MSYAVMGACIAAAVGVWLARRAKGALGDGDWGVLAVCAACGRDVPRWFFLDRGTARGPYSLYRYRVPDRCRSCRHQKGFVPLAWLPGETEAAHDARSDQALSARARPAPPS
jgi:hypothetical protein